MRAIATIIDGEIYSPAGVNINPERETRAVAAPVSRIEPRNIAPLDPLDEFNAHLAAAIRIAQSLSERDQQRASNFMEAARATLSACTRLESSEQRKWEAALRQTVVK